MRRFTLVLPLFLCLFSLDLQNHATAQTGSAPDSENLDRSDSSMRPLIERFTSDRGDLLRFYSIAIAPERWNRMKRLYTEWQARLPALDFARMNPDGQIDYLLFRNYLTHAIQNVGFEAEREAKTSSYLPFAATIIGLEEARRDGKPMDAQKVAATLTELKARIESEQKRRNAPPPAASPEAVEQRRVEANHAAADTAVLRQVLHDWFVFYNNYDPLFTWWNAEPYKQADAALDAYARFLREHVAGIKATKATAGDTSDIVGIPIGREALQSELAYEMIPYTPEELIAAANTELAWCENQMRLASREMGYGDDWKRALEKVKTMYVVPGEQPQLIRNLAREAEAFVDEHQLVTVPPIARETWSMEMMTPERQLVNPFLLGGDTIIVSYPTAEMSYEQKMMTMRGNNRPFSRATVFHELIPGHELQEYMAARYRPYRQNLAETPFLVEGWALYWELRFWDLGFDKTPEERIGALFWRMHRCARIIFSLSFHLGKMTPQRCVDFLVNRVGHERENAIAEVRRSFAGDYGPLYQAAYLLGGMQLYALHAELVGSHKMTERQFNDAVLQQNMLPIEIMRAALTGQKLTRDYHASWKFLANNPLPGMQ